MMTKLYLNILCIIIHAKNFIEMEGSYRFSSVEIFNLKRNQHQDVDRSFKINTNSKSNIICFYSKHDKPVRKTKNIKKKISPGIRGTYFRG